MKWNPLPTYISTHLCMYAYKQVGTVCPCCYQPSTPLSPWWKGVLMVGEQFWHIRMDPVPEKLQTFLLLLSQGAHSQWGKSKRKSGPEEKLRLYFPQPTKAPSQTNQPTDSSPFPPVLQQMRLLRLPTLLSLCVNPTLHSYHSKNKT